MRRVRLEAMVTKAVKPAVFLLAEAARAEQAAVIAAQVVA